LRPDAEGLHSLGAPGGDIGVTHVPQKPQSAFVVHSPARISARQVVSFLTNSS